LVLSSRAQDAAPAAKRNEPPRVQNAGADAPRTDAAKENGDWAGTDLNAVVSEKIVPQFKTIWDLTVRGGIFMIPLGMCSVAVLAFAFERMIALRARRIMPPRLLVALQRLSHETRGIDPRQAYAVCEAHPSPMANVLRTAISKIGRPYSELEKAVEGGRARSRHHGPQHPSDQRLRQRGPVARSAGDRARHDHGLYGHKHDDGNRHSQGTGTALVTTFAGLCIAIPAILIAHMLEGKIERLLRDMEDVFLELIPQFERFEEQARAARPTGAAAATASQHAIPATAVPPATGKATAAAARPQTAAMPAGEPPVVQPTSKGLWEVMGSRKSRPGES
jgi:biopolymer transport protein ExbB